MTIYKHWKLPTVVQLCCWNVHPASRMSTTCDMWDMWSIVKCFSQSTTLFPMQGYQQRRGYIATQGPLEHTTGYLWRMVVENECSCIVMLCTLGEVGGNLNACVSRKWIYLQMLCLSTQVCLYNPPLHTHTHNNGIWFVALECSSPCMLATQDWGCGRCVPVHQVLLANRGRG